MIRAKNSIYEITPYVGGESKLNNGAKNSQRVIKLSSNEGAFGPPPMAITAMQEAAQEAHRYPDGGCVALRQAIAEANDIPADRIVCGAGSDEIISLLCQAYAGEGDEVLYSQHGFLMYAISAQAAGATPVTAPEKDLKADVDSLIGAITDRTKLLFIANPNNPTGSYLTREDLVALHSRLPKDVLLVIDAAYAEYVDDPAYTIGHDLVEAHDNVVVTRTFSKLYAMGGLRLGWAHGPDHVIDILNRVRGPFNVSNIAQVAGVSALQDKAFVEKSLDNNRMCRAFTEDALEAVGLKVYPSAGNFLLVDFGDADKAEATRLALMGQGIIIRQVGVYGLPTCLRITIGTKEEMELAVDGIKGYLNSHG